MNFYDEQLLSAHQSDAVNMCDATGDATTAAAGLQKNSHTICISLLVYVFANYIYDCSK